jgi:hypothetical protein
VWRCILFNPVEMSFGAFCIEAVVISTATWTQCWWEEKC